LAAETSEQRDRQMTLEKGCGTSAPHPAVGGRLPLPAEVRSKTLSFRKDEVRYECDPTR